MKYNVDVWTMIQMTLTRIVKVLEFTAMIKQTSWIQNIVIDTIKEWGCKEHLHFGDTLPDVTVIQVSHNVDLLLVNTKLGQIMRIMEINIWLLETLFILSIQTFEGQYFLYEGRKLIATMNRVLEDGSILGSRPAKTCHAWAVPWMKISTVLTQSNSRGCFWQKCQERKEL